MLTDCTLIAVLYFQLCGFLPTNCRPQGLRMLARPTFSIKVPGQSRPLSKGFASIVLLHRNLKLTTTSMSETTGSGPHIAGLNLQLFRVCRVASSIERAALPTS